jgi:hypothetical protein
MTTGERDSVEFLLASCEAYQRTLVACLRGVQACQRVLTTPESTELHRFIVSLNFEPTIAQALSLTQRSEQLFAKLRELLPEIEADEPWRS